MTNNSPPDAEETAAIKQQEYENVKAEEQESNTQAIQEGMSNTIQQTRKQKKIQE